MHAGLRQNIYRPFFQVLEIIIYGYNFISMINNDLSILIKWDSKSYYLGQIKKQIMILEGVSYLVFMYSNRHMF